MDELKEIGTHLEELRKRVIRIVIAVGIIAGFILGFHITPFDYNGISLYYPNPNPIDNIASQVMLAMKNQLVPENVQLIQTAPGQALFAQLYVAALLGIVIGMPIIVKEFVGFFTPALNKKEIQIIKSITLPAIGLFVAGCVFSYFVATPYILNFLYQYGESIKLVTFLNVVDFVTFILQFILAFGISFQLPLIMYVTSASGLTDEKFWRKNIRYSVVIMVVAGAWITPDGSGITMWFVAGPMIALYLIGMILVEHQHRQIATLKS